MLHASSPGSLAKGRFDIYSELLNPLRRSRRGFDPARESMPAGPDLGHLHKRQMHRQLRPDQYSHLPPLPELRGRDAYRRDYSSPHPLERPRPVHSQGPQNYAQLAHQKYLERKAQEAVQVSPEERRQQAIEMQRFSAAQQRLSNQVERFRSMPLMSNIQRNPDLNHYERAELNLDAMNVDQMRLLKNIPVGTDLYRFKVEQAKETGVMRGEVMKMIEEQRLKEVKKKFDLKVLKEDASLNNRLWSDEQIKNIIQKRMREALGKETNLEHNNN